MTTKHTQHIGRRARLAIAVGVVCASLGASAGDTFKMQVHPKETPGTWEIVHGEYNRAITLLEIAAVRSKLGRDQGPILTNLCVAYTKIGNYETAAGYCDRAVQMSSHFGVAYNNRGVLQALKHDFASAAMDFEAAKKRGESAETAKFNIERLGEQVSVSNDAPQDASAKSKV